MPYKNDCNDDSEAINEIAEQHNMINNLALLNDVSAKTTHQINCFVISIAHWHVQTTTLSVANNSVRFHCFRATTWNVSRLRNADV